MNYFAIKVSNFIINSVNKSWRVYCSILFKSINIGGQLLILPIVYNKLNIYDFGIFATLNTIIIFSLNLDFGIVNAIKNPLHKSIQNRDAYNASLIICTSFFFMLSFGLFLLFVSIFGYILNIDRLFIVSINYDSVRPLFMYTACYYIIRFPLQLVNGINHSLNKYFMNDMLLMISTSLSVTFLLVLSFTENLNLATALHGFLIPQCVVYLVYFIWLVSKEKSFKFKITYFNLNELKQLLKSSSTFFYLQIGWIFATNFMPIILAKEVSVSMAGDYNIVMRLFNLAYVINFITLNNSWHGIHQASINNDVSLLMSKYRDVVKVSLLYVIICLLIGLFHEPILKLWIGKKIQVNSILITLSCFYFIGIILLSCLNIFMNSINFFRIQVILVTSNFILLPAIYYFLKHQTNLEPITNVMLSPLILVAINLILTFYSIQVLFKNLITKSPTLNTSQVEA